MARNRKSIKICGKCFANSIFTEFPKLVFKVKKYFNYEDICSDCLPILQKQMEEEILQIKQRKYIK